MASSQRPRRAHFQRDCDEALFFVSQWCRRAPDARLLIDDGWPPALVMLAFSFHPHMPLDKLKAVMINQGRRIATDRARFNRHAKAKGHPTC